MAFKEPVHKIVDRIKNEPFFRWLNKKGETPLGETKTCIVLTTGVERPSRAVNESWTLKGIRGGIRESWYRAGGSIKREPSLATLRSD